MVKNSRKREGVRRDDKGRILPKGISQRADGRYIWRFTHDGFTYPPVYNKDLKSLKDIVAVKKS